LSLSHLSILGQQLLLWNHGYALSALLGLFAQIIGQMATWAKLRLDMASGIAVFGGLRSQAPACAGAWSISRDSKRAAKVRKRVIVGFSHTST
jgi:hypothetical protein